MDNKTHALTINKEILCESSDYGDSLYLPENLTCMECAFVIERMLELRGKRLIEKERNVKTI